MDNDPLSALFEKYLAPGPDYTEQFNAAQKQADTQQAQFEALLRSAAARKAAAPSKAEVYFRLAQAFGKPTKSGNFFESLGNAGEVMGDVEAQKRAATEQNEQDQLGVNAKIAESNLGLTRAKLSDLRALAAGDINSRRSIVAELLKERSKAGMPTSEAGKAAYDAGLKPGTPEFKSYMDNYIQAKNERAAAGANAANARFQQTQAQLTPTELKMLDEHMAGVDATERTLALLRTAKEKSKLAFGNTLAERGQYQAMRQMKGMARDPRVSATEQLEQILTKSALEGLKASFGGNPTEGERAVALATQGLKASTPQSREAQIDELINLTTEQNKRLKAKVRDIQTGKFRARISADEAEAP